MSRVADTTMRAACIQMCSSEQVSENLNIAALLIEQAAQEDAHLVVLPETFACMTRSDTIRAHALGQAESILNFLREQAKQWNLWLIGGSVLIPKANGARCYNRCYLISPSGEIAAAYDKIHLFDALLSDQSWKESDYISRGKQAVTHACSPNWKLGLSICYDLRFPELYRYYRQCACNILSVPAAFTARTGEAHWSVLLRARAIENQCYVLASGQGGIHQDGRQTQGHSMIIDPWGDVLAEAPSEGEALIVAELSLSRVQEIRNRMSLEPHNIQNPAL